MSEAADNEAEKERRDPADWGTVRRFIPYLWPSERPDLRWRIAMAALFVLLSKIVVLALPFAYARAVDTMAGKIGGGAAVAFGLVLAYSAGRFAQCQRAVNGRGGQQWLPDLHRGTGCPFLLATNEARR